MEDYCSSVQWRGSCNNRRQRREKYLYFRKQRSHTKYWNGVWLTWVDDVLVRLFMGTRVWIAKRNWRKSEKRESKKKEKKEGTTRTVARHKTHSDHDIWRLWGPGRGELVSTTTDAGSFAHLATSLFIYLRHKWWNQLFPKCHTQEKLSSLVTFGKLRLTSSESDDEIIICVSRCFCDPFSFILSTVVKKDYF